ncbi:hypothetical protein H9X85_03720 [Anaerotignum lactatifermentans]|nr:hypothetical protein [Anaerotignum lactatifermentans]MBM6950321.1 hypothetical protein [Anaerotignum lactatifermentans]
MQTEKNDGKEKSFPKRRESPEKQVKKGLTLRPPCGKIFHTLADKHISP